MLDNDNFPCEKRENRPIAPNTEPQYRFVDSPPNMSIEEYSVYRAEQERQWQQEELRYFVLITLAWVIPLMLVLVVKYA